jgi:hypothetical protein
MKLQITTGKSTRRGILQVTGSETEQTERAKQTWRDVVNQKKKRKKAP